MLLVGAVTNAALSAQIVAVAGELGVVSAGAVSHVIVGEFDENVEGRSSTTWKKVALTPPKGALFLTFTV